MEKMNTSAIGKLMAAFVALMIGIVLIGQIATTGNGVTTLQPGTEVVSLADARVGLGWINNSISFSPAFLNATQTESWRSSISGCDVATIGSLVTVTNASGSLLVRNTDYIINATGDITFENTLAVNNSNSNTTTLAYTTCPSGYVYGWAATMLNLVYGLFALGALGISIALFYSIAKDYGMIG
jgi:hypothetical protein